jgi:alanine dehydrogenase
LTNATLPYIRALASKGIEAAIREDAVVRTALNTYRGEIVHEGLAQTIKT